MSMDRVHSRRFVRATLSYGTNGHFHACPCYADVVRGTNTRGMPNIGPCHKRVVLVWSMAAFSCERLISLFKPIQLPPGTSLFLIPLLGQV